MSAKRNPDTPIRPRHGVTVPAGWKICTDSPCQYCGQSAMMLDRQDKPSHPTCQADYRKKK